MKNVHALSRNGGPNRFPMVETARRACTVEAVILH